MPAKVVDASALVLLVTESPIAAPLRNRLREHDLHAPHLVDVEVAQALRQMNARHGLDEARATDALETFEQLRIERHSHAFLLPRAWELRRHITAYDAMYVALAELLRAPLVTADAKLARSHGHAARIELVR